MNKLNLSPTNPTTHTVEKKPGGWEATSTWHLPGDRRLEIYTWRASDTRMLETVAGVHLVNYTDGVPFRSQAIGVNGDYRHVIRKVQVLRLNETVLIEHHQRAIDDLFDSVVDEVVHHYKLENAA